MKQQTSKFAWSKKISEHFSYANLPGIFFLISIPGYFLYTLAVATVTNDLLASSAIPTKAIATRRFQFLSASNTSSYYSFKVNGKLYTGSQDMERSIGDSVEIEYAAHFPYCNRIITSR